MRHLCHKIWFASKLEWVIHVQMLTSVQHSRLNCFSKLQRNWWDQHLRLGKSWRFPWHHNRPCDVLTIWLESKIKHYAVNEKLFVKEKKITKVWLTTMSLYALGSDLYQSGNACIQTACGMPAFAFIEHRGLYISSLATRG